MWPKQQTCRGNVSLSEWWIAPGIDHAPWCSFDQWPKHPGQVVKTSRIQLKYPFHWLGCRICGCNKSITVVRLVSQDKNCWTHPHLQLLHECVNLWCWTAILTNPFFVHCFRLWSCHFSGLPAGFTYPGMRWGYPQIFQDATLCGSGMSRLRTGSDSYTVSEIQVQYIWSI